MTQGVIVGSNVEVIAWTITAIGSTGPTGPTNISIVDDTTTNATRYIHFGSTTTGTMATVNTSSTNLYFNPSTGNLTVSGSVTAYSDERIKTNVQQITGSLDRLLQLTGVTYTRTDTGANSRGLIAQAVAKVYPEMVVTNEQDGMMSVAYAQMMGDVIEAIRDLKAQVDALKS